MTKQIIDVESVQLISASEFWVNPSDSSNWKSPKI